MNQWTQRKDGWLYEQDGTQRYKIVDGRTIVESVPVGESLTQQQFKEDCDVNIIMERFMKTGEMPVAVAPMIEGDFSNLPSYQEALHTVMAADQMFMEIPATTRQRFGNDPQQLMDFLKDEKNKEESYKIGLRQHKPQPAIDPNTQLLTELVQNTKPKKSPAPQE